MTPPKDTNELWREVLNGEITRKQFVQEMRVHGADDHRPMDEFRSSLGHGAAREGSAFVREAGRHTPDIKTDPEGYNKAIANGHQITRHYTQQVCGNPNGPMHADETRIIYWPKQVDGNGHVMSATTNAQIDSMGMIAGVPLRNADGKLIQRLSPADIAAGRADFDNHHGAVTMKELQHLSDHHETMHVTNDGIKRNIFGNIEASHDKTPKPSPYNEAGITTTRNLVPGKDGSAPHYEAADKHTQSINDARSTMQGQVKPPSDVHPHAQISSGAPNVAAASQVVNVGKI